MEDEVVKFFKLVSKEVEELGQGVGHSKLLSQLIQEADILAETINNVIAEISNNNYSEVSRVNRVLERSQSRLSQ